MSRVYHPVNPDHVFSFRYEIEKYLLSKIASNSSGKVGTELELFVTTPEGLPITFHQVELLLETMAEHFCDASLIFEKGRVVALHVPRIGDVSLEPGAQVELSTAPVQTLEELQALNHILRGALEDAAGCLGLRVAGGGHNPAFLKAEDTPRTRFGAYREYLSAAYGRNVADALVATMKSVAGLQVNVDPMGEEFHEIYRALLLVDVAGSFRDRTPRQKLLHETYAIPVPEQLLPVFEALKESTNEGVVRVITDRLLSLRVPFIPEGSSEGFRSTQSLFGFTPSVDQLLSAQKLTASILDNALSLQLTMPNLRRHGVLETRAPDSPPTTDGLMSVARLYVTYAYNKEARRELLRASESMDIELLQQAFLDRFEDKDILQRKIGDGQDVSSLIEVVEKKRQALEKKKNLVPPLTRPSPRP